MLVNTPIEFCQNVTLVSGSYYSLAYDLFCPIDLDNMTLYVKIDGIIVDNLQIVNAVNSGEFGTKTSYFTAVNQYT